MTQQQYEKWSYVFRKEEKRIRFLNRADRMITACVFLSYPGLLLYLFGTKRFFELFFCAAIPAVSFAAVSAFRAVYSAKRPYEVLDIQPLIKKETEGKSFPSRHVFSVFIIGMSFFYIAEPMDRRLCIRNCPGISSGRRRRPFSKRCSGRRAVWHFMRTAVLFSLTAYSSIE